MAAAFNLAYWISANRADAEDIVQDAYLRAFRAFHQHRGDDVRPWLLAIVRNVAYRALQNRKSGANVISLDEMLTSADGGTREIVIADDQPSAEANLVAAADQALVRRALLQVPVAYRDVLVLREFEDMSYREIAAVIGSPVGTVMSRLARGRAELRKVIERLEAGGNANAV